MKSNVQRGFTLIEMLVATVLSAVLISAVLLMLAGVSRDRKMLNRLNSTQPPSGIVELVSWDLGNARSVARGSDDRSLVLVGLGGIDAASLIPNGRLVQVRYQFESKNLWRIQEYLDDAAYPGIWHELVAANVSDFSIDPASELPAQMPAHMRLRLNSANGSIDQRLWIK